MRFIFFLPFLACLLIVAAFLYVVKSVRDCSCCGQRDRSTGSDTVDQRANLLATEQQTYDSIRPASMPPATVVISHANTSSSNSQPVVREARIITVPANDPPPPPEGVNVTDEKRASSGDESVPAGYKHDYSAASNRGASVQDIINSVQNPGKLARRTRINPFDDENEASDAQDSFEHKLKRPTSTNPFDEDYVEPKPSAQPHNEPE